MTNFQTDYQPLITVAEDSEVTPENDVLFHAQEQRRWTHINDLDTFFRRCYRFHQLGGFGCIATIEFFNLLQFGFIFCLAVYAGNCINYGVVGRYSYSNTTHVKLGVNDLCIPVCTCLKGLNNFWWFLIIIAILFGIFYIARTVWRLCYFHNIKNFYETCLKIPSSEIQNIPWHEVQVRLRTVQRVELMSIHKPDLSELDIYSRILRHENYMVAMMNKNILPIKYDLKIAEVTYFPPLLNYCLHLLLFRSPYSPFKSTWQLKEDYKKFSNRHIHANELARGLLFMTIISFPSCIFVFAFLVLHFCTNYAGLIRKEPSFLSTRKWSTYALLYLRHFNELEHELTARLNRAYNPAAHYMNSYYSQLTTTIYRNISGITGVIALFILVWTIVQPALMHEAEHVIGVFSVCTFISGFCIGNLPKDNLVSVPESLMTKIIAEIHYRPDVWIGKAHHPMVRKEFSQLFQLRISSIIEHLISPFVVPFLLFKLRSRALDIVDFFRSFTVDVAGVGDVCSFALMDISRHGNHEWVGDTETKADHFQQAENGKTELSLIHFTLTNPDWESPPAASAFINNVKEQAQKHAREPRIDNALLSSLHSLQHSGSEYSDYVGALTVDLYRQRMNRMPMSQSLLCSNTGPVIQGCINHTEGPLYTSQAGVLANVASCSQNIDSMPHPYEVINPVEFRAAEISLTSLYLHGLHHRRLQELRQPRIMQQPQSLRNQDAGDNTNNEQQPLLDTRALTSI